MSAEKRQQLIDSGQLREDGSRIERCPHCGKELTPEEFEALQGSAVAQPNVVEAGASDPAEEG